MQYQEDFESHSIGVFVVVVWDVKADDSTPAFDLKFYLFSNVYVGSKNKVSNTEGEVAVKCRDGFIALSVY